MNDKKGLPPKYTQLLRFFAEPVSCRELQKKLTTAGIHRPIARTAIKALESAGLLTRIHRPENPGLGRRGCTWQIAQPVKKKRRGR